MIHNNRTAKQLLRLCHSFQLFSIATWVNNQNKCPSEITWLNIFALHSFNISIVAILKFTKEILHLHVEPIKKKRITYKQIKIFIPEESLHIFKETNKCLSKKCNNYGNYGWTAIKLEWPTFGTFVCTLGAGTAILRLEVPSETLVHTLSR